MFTTLTLATSVKWSLAGAWKGIISLRTQRIVGSQSKQCWTRLTKSDNMTFSLRALSAIKPLLNCHLSDIYTHSWNLYKCMEGYPNFPRTSPGKWKAVFRWLTFQQSSLACTLQIIFLRKLPTKLLLSYPNHTVPDLSLYLLCPAPSSKIITPCNCSSLNKIHCDFIARMCVTHI